MASPLLRSPTNSSVDDEGEEESLGKWMLSFKVSLKLYNRNSDIRRSTRKLPKYAGRNTKTLSDAMSKVQGGSRLAGSFFQQQAVHLHAVYLHSCFARRVSFFTILTSLLWQKKFAAVEKEFLNLMFT